MPRRIESVTEEETKDGVVRSPKKSSDSLRDIGLRIPQRIESTTDAEATSDPLPKKNNKKMHSLRDVG